MTLTATPDEGWSFSAWTGDCSGTETTCTLTMDGPKSVSAIFTQDEYALTITQATGGTITAEPLGPYHLNDEVTLTATSDPGWTFSGWTGDCSGTETTCTLTMDGPKSVSAVFTQDEYALTITQATGGTITAEPLGPYHLNDEVTLTATADLGYSFSNWAGDCSGTETTCTLTMDGPKSVSAVFTQDEYALTITQATGGTITAEPLGPYHLNDEVTLTAAADPGYTFTNWTGDCSGTETTCTLTMDGPKSVSAVFTQDEYALTITQATGGTITAEPLGPYHLNDEVTLTAAADLGYTFTNWAGDCSGTETTCTLTMDGPKSVSAVFTQDEYALTITQATGGTITAEPLGPYHLNDEVTLTAAADLGYTFTNWTGDCSGTETTCTLTMDGPKSVSAVFTQDEYALTINAVNGSVSRSPDQGTYHLGDVVTLEATAEVGYTFSNWSGDLSGSTNPANVTITGNMIITANFTQDEYTLTVTINGNGSVSKEPDQANYTYGTEVTLTPVADAGWSFSTWSGPDAADLTDNGDGTWSLLMNGTKSLTANFELNVVTLTINPTVGGAIEATPAGPYYYGDDVTLTATADPGYTFTGWTDDLAGETNSPFVLHLDGDKTVGATFTQDQYILTITTIGEGRVVTEPEEAVYTYGEQVALIALPEVGWSFSGWSGACSGTSACTVTMEDNLNVTATFEPVEYHLTVVEVGSGSVTLSPDQATYHLGDLVELTATPVAGWSFVGWGGDLSGVANPTSILVDRELSVIANFVQDEVLPKDLIVSPGTLREDFETLDGWTVSGSLSGSYFVVADATNYKVGSGSLKLTTPANGYVQISKPVNWDLSAPDEQGNFRLWVYVYGSAEPSDFRIMLSNDATYQNYFVTYYHDAYKLPYRPGWNLINLQTSNWKVGAGTPSWAHPIVHARIRFSGSTVGSYSIDGLTSGVVSQPAMLFTFDDGASSLYSQAFSYMRTHNVRGTAYVATDWVDGINRVTWTQLQEMDANGWIIGNQTMSHTDLSSLTEAGQEAELLGAQSALNAHGVTNVDYVAYPYGSYNNDTLIAMSNLGMRTGRTLLGFNNLSPVEHPFEIAQRTVGNATTLSTVKGWVSNAKDRQEILVVTLHGLSISPTGDEWSLSNFQSLLDYCIQQGIPLITMDDLYRLQSMDITIPGAR